MEISFETLKIDEEFEMWGDIYLNYDYPKLCRCVKKDYDRAEEIDGISFYLDYNAMVLKIND